MAWIDKKFRLYVDTLTFLADQIRWSRTKDTGPVWVQTNDLTIFEGNIHSIQRLRDKGLIVSRWPEKIAYDMTKESRELKRFQFSGNWMGSHPERGCYEGLPSKACHERFWRMVRQPESPGLGISEPTISTINEEYEKFLLEVTERKRKGFDYKREIREKMKDYGFK
ncbi:MAG: hypothetical protein KAR42_17720 [candidate division Zixibacteria bacterium]|nr:hypothetical protein [candidate division Zixibacteria bacterium]